MDYKRLGRQLYYFHAPHSVDSEGFDSEALKEVARDKITELSNRLKEITARNKIRKELLRIIKDPYFQFHADFWFYDYHNEKHFIEKWLYYWKSFTPEQQPKINSDRLTDDQIKQASSFPLDQLYIGELRRISGKFVGLCPFHQEKTPSFTIFSSNSFYCFGCQKSGNPITYLMETKHLGFKDAVKELI